MKIWQRHIFSQLFVTFTFILFSIFFIYVIVDLSVHGVRFLTFGKAGEVALYYIHTISTLLELFLTLSFLLATMRVLYDLNDHREILALLMAGLSKKRLLAPFFVFAAFLSLVCYVNSQWLLPNAQDITDTFRDTHKKKKRKPDKLYSISMKDDSELVYQKFDPEKKELFDVFWVQTPNSIWHMKVLEIAPLRGRYVNHFTRNEDKQLIKEASYLAKEFPELPWDEEAILHRFVPYENRPLSGLATSSLPHFYYKLLNPLMPFLVLFAMAPVSLRYTRNYPALLIAACSIFGFISLKIILDGMLILGENQVLPAALALFGPILLTFGFTFPQFARMR